MIGNDIIDLSIAKVGEGMRRLRFLKKIFTDTELAFIKDSQREDLYIWLMWSIKESVYKIIVRKENRIRYAPKSICCDSVVPLKNNVYKSTVVYNGRYFYSRSIIKGDCIHTIAFKDRGIKNDIQSASFEINKINHRGGSLDEQVMKSLDHSKNNVKSQIWIQRDGNRIPRIYKNDKEIGMLSLSHHGRFEGYAYLNL